MPPSHLRSVLVIGGGAAGFFSAIQASKNARVTLLEKSNKLLSKVAISGGGRCNVTHNCFDPAKLVLAYPRGSKALLGPFHRFQPKDTIAWFEERGVKLKVEGDGRMFPVTDSSSTIINCLIEAAKDVDIRTLSDVVNIEPGFKITLKNGQELLADKVIVASGGTKNMYSLIERLGHTIVPPAPSLFTLNLLDPWVDLAGVSLKLVEAKIEGAAQEGPCVITHWGFSGPAFLKLSAWGARELLAMNYKGVLSVNWLPGVPCEALLKETRQKFGGKKVEAHCPFDLPKALWRKLTEGIDVLWSHLSQKDLALLLERLTRSKFPFDGKSTNKEEFVTAGGVALSEVNFKTMESKFCPGLHFAGEVLDIDGITGGFNFQSAWTTGWIAGNAAVD